MTPTAFPQSEGEILKFWRERQIFKKSLEKSSSKDFVFYDGPPFATGLPHYGHIIASAIKDVIPRYKTMQGFRVARRWGWDCHGLPIENLIEKELGLKIKKDIERLGIDKFNQACRDSVLRYAKDWKKFIPRMARWVDMDNDYRTMDNRYIEVIWWIFKELYKEGLIYQGYKAMHLCPRCETTLSNFEVTLGYKEVRDLSVYVKFKIQNSKFKNQNVIQNSKFSDNIYFLAWTTTPWTLPGNMALAVGENIDYILLKVCQTQSERYIKAGETIIVSSDFKFPFGAFKGINATKLQKPWDHGRFNQKLSYDLLELSWLDDLSCSLFERVGIIKGSDLAGLEYEPLFDFSDKEIKKDKNYQNAFKIYAADFVSTEEGTGIVHIAPAFGENDYQLSQKHQIPFLQHVNRDGTFKDYVKPWAGQKVREKDDDQKINIEVIKWLAAHNQLFAKEKYTHSYPHCWRCDTPLLNYATSSWFVKIDDDFKKRLLAANEKIKWVPGHLKKGRFGKWLEGARDWAISRSRYWGAPIPVWRCEQQKCDELKVISSKRELGQEIENLHRPYIDEVKLKCDKCGGEMKRIEEVFDCWFESGSMPYASEIMFSGYKLSPGTSRQELLKHLPFPADFIAEGVDQTRGWFYTLLVLGVALYGESPFKNVIVNGIILAEDGQKMSKRLKNYPDPNDIINKYGADAMRFYLLSSPAVRGESFNFSEKGVDEVYKKVVLLVLNVLKFWEMYADSSKFKVQSLQLPLQSDIDVFLDSWILNRLWQLIKDTTEAFDAYEIDRACKQIVNFVDDLSTWYLRRSRERFKDTKKGLFIALKCLQFVLITLSKVIAPLMPFLAENIYGRVRDRKFSNYKFKESVHLEQWPADSYRRQEPDDRLLKDMQDIRQICAIGHSLRVGNKIKVRQVLRTCSVLKTKCLIFQSKDLLDLKELIQDELNVKEVEIVDKLPQGEGWISKDGVALYTVIDEELREEGIVRELTRQINNLRKKQGLTINDQVILEYATESVELRQVIEKNQEDLKRAVLAQAMVRQVTLEGEKLKVAGDEMIVKFKRLGSSRFK